MVRIHTNQGRSAGRRLVVVKQVDDIGLFDYQVRWLSQTQGSGAVVLEHIDRANSTYSTRYAGSHTLATWARDPVVAYPLARQLISVLLQLHQQGQTHGGLTLDHVVVGRHGPVLVSPKPLPVGQPTGQADLDDLGTMLTNLAHLWRVTGAADDEAIVRWSTTGQALQHCRPNRHNRLRTLVGHLRPSRRLRRRRRPNVNRSTGFVSRYPV